MNLYEKKIVYLHKAEGDGTTENCGFVSFQCIPGGYKLTVQLRSLQRPAGEKENSEGKQLFTWLWQNCRKKKEIILRTKEW